MSKRSPSKLSSFFDSSVYTESLPNVSDFLNMPLEIQGVAWRKGQNGEYAIVTVNLLESGSLVKFQTGAQAIIDMLHAAENRHAFPFECMIIQINRAYVPKDIEDDSR